MAKQIKSDEEISRPGMPTGETGEALANRAAERHEIGGIVPKVEADEDEDPEA